MDHPNIAKYYKVLYDNSFINIVMEYINGQPISDVIMDHKDPAGRIPEQITKNIIK